MPSVFVQQPAPPELCSSDPGTEPSPSGPPAAAAPRWPRPQTPQSARRPVVRSPAPLPLPTRRWAPAAPAAARCRQRPLPAAAASSCSTPGPVGRRWASRSCWQWAPASLRAWWVGQGGLGGTVGRRRRRRRQGPERISKRRAPDGLHSLPRIASAAAMARRRCCCSVRKPLCEKGAVCGGAPLPTHRSTCQEDVEQLGGPAPSAGREVSSAASATPFLPFQAADRAKPKLGKRATAP